MPSLLIEETSANMQGAAGPPSVHMLNGSEVVLRMQHMLVELCARCDQHGAMDHLGYFLKRPKFANKIPRLILFSSRADGGLPTSSDEIDAAVLLYQYRIAGFGCRIFAADYHAGDSTVIAPRHDRVRIASLVCAALLERGALVVQITYQTDPAAPEEHHVRDVKGSPRWRWGSTAREMHGYIPLADGYDATLANLGQHTRRNLRASRRYAETNLGYTFVTNPTMTKDEFVAFNRISAYPASDETAAWRCDAMNLVPESLFLGLKSADGEWMSVIGGRCHQRGTVIEWQMNRADMTAFSLSTLMRSHLIEHESERGSRRLYFVGGTSHTMRHSLIREQFVDLVVMRRSLPAFLLRRFARPLMLEKTFLIQTLVDPKLKWQRW